MTRPRESVGVGGGQQAAAVPGNSGEQVAGPYQSMVSLQPKESAEDQIILDK